MRKLSTLFISLLAVLGITLSVSAASYLELQEEINNIQTGLIVLLVLLCIVILLEVVLRLLVFKRRRVRGRVLRRTANQRLILTVLNFTLIWVVLTAAFGGYRYFVTQPRVQEALLATQTTPPAATESMPVATEPAVTEPIVTEPIQTEPPETEPPVTEPVRLPLEPAKTESSDPANWKMRWDVIVNNKVVSDFVQAQEITFPENTDFYPLPGMF